MLKNFLKHYFSFSKKERSGTLLLLILLLSIISGIFFIKSIEPKSNLNLSEIKSQVDSLRIEEEKQKKQRTYKKKYASKQKYKKKVSPKKTYKKPYHKTKKSYNSKTVEINSADSLTLANEANVRGYLIKSIIKYRALLGGYYSITQLNEVYNVKPSSYKYLQKVLTVDSTIIKKININNASYKTLIKHPYLNKEDVSVIIKARKNKNITPNDLMILLDQKLYYKIAPYLNFDDKS